jgi:hypothetical protein
VSSAAFEQALEYVLTEYSSAPTTEGPQSEASDDATHDDASFGALLTAELLELVHNEEAQQQPTYDGELAVTYMKALWESNRCCVTSDPLDYNCTDTPIALPSDTGFISSEVWESMAEAPTHMLVRRKP